jgi:glycine/serine hydroxymethyltransferase
MKEDEMKQIGGCIAAVLKKPGDEQVVGDIRIDVLGLCRRFPLFSGTEA